MKSLHVCASMLLCTGGVLTCLPPVAAGTQTMVARYTQRPVVIDGALGPAEWSAAVPVHVKANKPGGPPGVVPGFIAPPDNQDDSSFTIYAMYDRSNLYVAVDVADNILWSNGPTVWLDDDVEVFIDGDRKPGDLIAGFSGQPNNEGFQLLTSVGNERLTEPEGFSPIVWESRAGLRPRGYVVEVRIPFSSINTHDTSPETGGTPGFRPLQPGDTIGFNVAVGDDDCGCSTFDNNYPYPNGYIAWDGSILDRLFAHETDWGSLYLQP